MDRTRPRGRVRATRHEEAAPTRSYGPEASDATVYVVDADPSARSGAEAVIERAGWRAESFASARAFLAAPAPPGPCCLILELTPPDLCGLEVQRRIAARTRQMPVIFITDRSDVRMTVRAMKAGAVELLPKPIDREALLEAVTAALHASRVALGRAADARALQERYASLSGREREVMQRVTAGLLNKQVGGELGISEITVKAHRGQVMRKMQAKTLVELVGMSAKLRHIALPQSWNTGLG
jgi:FixJ family two-component response regulator